MQSVLRYPGTVFLVALVLPGVLAGCPWGWLFGGCGGSWPVFVVRPLSLHVTDDLSGQPWDDDGTAPDLVVQLFCGDSMLGISPVSTQPVEALDAQYPQDAWGGCRFSTREEMMAATIGVLAVDQDQPASEPVTGTLVIRPTMDHVTAGGMVVGAVDGLVSLQLVLREEVQGQVTVVPARFELAPDRNGTPWDRDGTPPDVEITVHCPSPYAYPSRSLPVEALSGEFPPSGGCSMTLEALLDQGFTVSLVDVDETEVATQVAPFRLTEGQAAAGTVEFTMVGNTRRLVLSVRQEEQQSFCD